MARYIDADKLTVKLNETQIEFDKNYYGLGEAKQIVDNVPTANVVERKKIEKAIEEIQKLRGCSCSCSDGIIDDVEDILDKLIESEEKNDINS